MDSASCSDQFSCPTPASVEFRLQKKCESGRLASFKSVLSEWMHPQFVREPVLVVQAHLRARV
jgi:hypothetical protein